MEEMLLKSILNYGIFPAITLYLIFVIIKDFKKDIEDLKNNTIENNQEILKQYSNLNSSINELITVNEQIQNIMVKYLDRIISKSVENLDDDQ